MTRQAMVRAAFALGLLAALVGGPATSALGAVPLYDLDQCAGSPFSPEGSSGERAFFTPELSEIPYGMRQFEPTCASHIADEQIDSSGIHFAYNLIYTSLDFRQFVRMLQSLEGDGWTYDGTNRNIDLGDGAGPLHLEYSIAQLAALDRAPALVQGALSLPSGSLLSMQWSDGKQASLFTDWTTPTLVVDLLLEEKFSSTGIADQSVLSSLKTIADALPSPPQTIVLCTSAVMLMLIIGWPGALLNGVIGKHYERIAGRMKSDLFAKPRAFLNKPQPRWLVWIGFVVAAIIAGFVDPAFGANAMSARVLVSGFLSFLVFNFAAWTLVRVIVRRVQPDSKPIVNFRWGSLVIVLAAVLVARLLDFNPGVIFGLVAGLTYAVSLVASRQALVVLVGSGFALVIALLAWAGYSLLSPVADGSANPLLVFLNEFFSGITIEGISALPIALLPFAVLDGGHLFAWKKWVWGLAYALALAGFMLVLVTIPASFDRIPGDFVRWLLIFVVFGVVAVGVWAIDAAIGRRRAAASAVSEPVP